MSVTFEANVLKDLNKNELVELVMSLKSENDSLKSNQKKVDDRITKLERSHYLYLQYGRRDTIEITGIPSQIETTKLEDEVIKIYNEAQAKVHEEPLSNMDIQAAHRIGKKGVTIVKFVNRKFALEGLRCGKNLKGSKLYGNTGIYINNSFCHEYKFIGYAIRTLKKENLIEQYRVRNGVFSIKIGENFEEISHISDFLTYNLDISAFQ